MQAEIDFTKSAQRNANDYYTKSKKLAAKMDGAEKAIKELEKRLKDAEQRGNEKSERRIIKKVEREWYEKFRWFFTSSGLLVIGGRDAHQNEMLNSKHFEDRDLFFHADIFGGSVTILKEGMGSPKEVREEVAQFAACNSRAWEEGLRSVDVYAMRREQVSKATAKGSLGTGSFLLSGEREWYRNTQLALVMFVKDGKLQTVPLSTYQKTEGDDRAVKVLQGNHKRSDAAKMISKLAGFEDIDEIVRQLPGNGVKAEKI